MKGNDFVTRVLRSPLHALLGHAMLITVRGRKTGREISLPVNYYREGDTLWIISSRSRKWWRNIAPGSPVRLHLHGRDIQGMAELVLDRSAVAAQAAAYVRRSPLSARALGIRLEGGVPNVADIQRVAGQHLFIAVCTRGVAA